MLVSTQWLFEHLNDKNLVLLDASMSKIVGKEPIEYEQPAYIPGSQKLDLENDLLDKTSSMVNAFPTPEQFSQVVSQFGITPDSTVVIYDNQGLYSSPRAWWIYYAMGMRDVKVLDGGLPQWIDDGYAVVGALETIAEPHDVNAKFNPQLVCDAQFVLNSIDDATVSIIDARGAKRFTGEMAEPRAGMRSGHIPNSLNLPFAQVLAGHKFKSESELQALFAELVPAESKLVFSCGSGLTACIVMLAAHVAGFTDTTLYDGSWAEWGANGELPIS